MIPTPGTRARVAAAALALAGYAACGDQPAPAQHTAYSDGPKPNHRNTDDADREFAMRLADRLDDTDRRIRLVARATRSTPKRSTVQGGEGRGDCTLDDIKRMESGGNYGAVSATGKYRGAYQFDARTWQSVGGSGDPAAASPAEQDARAAELMRQRGTQPWSVCR